MKEMIVCTCDVCGQQTESWTSLNVSFSSNIYKKEICPNCKNKINNDLQNFIKEEFLTED